MDNLTKPLTYFHEQLLQFYYSYERFNVIIASLLTKYNHTTLLFITHHTIRIFMDIIRLDLAIKKSNYILSVKILEVGSEKIFFQSYKNKTEMKITFNIMKCS